MLFGFCLCIGLCFDSYREVYWSCWCFVFQSFHNGLFFIFLCRCLVLRLGGKGYVYETFGISKRFPVKLQQLLIRAEMLDKPLTVKCVFTMLGAVFLSSNYHLNLKYRILILFSLISIKPSALPVSLPNFNNWKSSFCILHLYE